MCLKANEVFVFGSNLAGRHGKGAALHAFQEHGAVRGLGEGMQGTAYAIPTKDADLIVLPLGSICVHVRRFLDYARKNEHLTFHVTRVGCGLAGYRDNQVAPLFRNAPKNVVFFEPIWNTLCGRRA